MLNGFCRIGLALLTSLLAVVPPATRADGVPPGSPLGRRAGAYFDAFNSGESRRMKDFIEENFTADSLARRPIADRLAVYQEIKDNDGSFRPARFVEEKDGSLTVYATNKDGKWRRFGFQAETGGDRRLTGIQIEESEPPPGEGDAGAALGRAPKATDAEAAAAADAAAAELAAKGEFSGAVLMARNGEVFLKKGYGLANREWNVPNGPETKFNIGSMNKIFTTVAIARLASAGSISLDDTIRKWLPDYTAAYAEKVTVRQLVAMRSGMGDFFGPGFDATPAGKVRGLRDYLPFFEGNPLKFEPGTSRAYSNAGFIVLGLIIEKASGEDYYDYCRHHIFEPAGMKDTASFELDEVVPGRAEGYTTRSSVRTAAGSRELSRAVLSLPGRGSSAGGGYSTVDDLLRFDRAFRSNRFVSAAWTAWICSDKVGTPIGGASGPALRGDFGFAGGSPGTNAEMDMDFDTGSTVIVLSNFDPPGAESLARRIRAWMPR